MEKDKKSKKKTEGPKKGEWGYEIVKDFIDKESGDTRDLNCEGKD